MVRVIDLLGIPSLEKGYLVAGYEGVSKMVKRIDILEVPYPQADKYLVPEVVMFTSFWSLKDQDDKENRIKLTQAMIRQNCSGLAIMPSLHMNDIIDQEIIDLANEAEFPVIYVPSTAHWSDIFSEYATLSHIKISSVMDADFLGVLDDFSDLHVTKDLHKFCISLENRLSISIILSVNNHIYCSDKNASIAPVIISKAKSIKKSKKNKVDLPVSYQIQDEHLAKVYFGLNSICAIYFSSESGSASSSRILNNMIILNKIAPAITRELDNLYIEPSKSKLPAPFEIKDDKLYYIVFIKKENVHSYLDSIDSKYTVFEANALHHYVIFLIQDDGKSSSAIYSEYGLFIEEHSPELFIFSSGSMCRNELLLEIKQFEYVGNVLLTLKGVFCTSELPMLYCLYCAPRVYKNHLHKYIRLFGNIKNTDAASLDTLRLYIVLKNVKDVSHLLQIHFNSVKYRIHKSLTLFDVECGSITSLPSAKLLVLLQLMKLENIYIK